MLLNIRRWWTGSRDADIRAATTLQQVLYLTLRCAVFYPRVADRMTELNLDPALRTQLLQWGAMMISTSDVIASLIVELGYDPRWYVDCGPDELEPTDFCHAEILRMSKAISLLQKAVLLAKDERMRRTLDNIVAAKERHLQELQEIQWGTPSAAD